MPRGWITTARGEQLNIDDLIDKSRRPPNLKDEKSEIKKKVVARKTPINVRGYKPAQGEAPVPELPEGVIQQVDEKQKALFGKKKPVSAYREGQEAEKLSDLTGVMVKPTEAAVERRKAQIASERGEAPEGGNEALNEILEELEPEKKPTRRTRKKTQA